MIRSHGEICGSRGSFETSSVSSKKHFTLTTSIRDIFPVIVTVERFVIMSFNMQYTKYIQNLNNLDNAPNDVTVDVNPPDHFRPWEGLKCVNANSKNFVDVASISPTANREEAWRRYVVKQLHTCEFCQKQFHRKDHFDNHVRTHTGDKPFACYKCLKSFGSSSNLWHHKKRCITKFERRTETSKFTVDHSPSQQ